MKHALSKLTVVKVSGSIKTEHFSAEQTLLLSVPQSSDLLASCMIPLE